LKFHIRAWLSGQILHTVEIPKETPLYAPDLRGISLENAQLNGADLRYANLAGVCLRGARLREAILDHANLSGADLSYTDLTGATLKEANLNQAIFYPCQMPKRGGALWGAKFSPDSEAAAESSRMAQEMARRNGIRPGSVAYGLLDGIYNWSSKPVPSLSPESMPIRQFLAFKKMTLASLADSACL
jgi:pentapeptide repeat protein